MFGEKSNYEAPHFAIFSILQITYYQTDLTYHKAWVLSPVQVIIFVWIIYRCIYCNRNLLNSVADYVQQWNNLFEKYFEKKLQSGRWTLKWWKLHERDLKETPFIMNVQEHMHYLFIRKDTFLFTFTVTSHADSVKLFYMLKHSRKT
jgi:hypothetical protein